MSITLYLLNKKGYLCLLNVLKNTGFSFMIDQVVTAIDTGNKEDYSNEITALCVENNIKIFKRNENFENNSTYSLAIGWRWLIYNSKNLIVIHDSLLPKYRGFSPLPNMLINGENEIGATAIFANENMDQGDIIFSEKIIIEYPITISVAIDLMCEIYVSLILRIFSLIINNESIPREMQDEIQATYSIWRDKEDYFVDWNNDAETIERFINAVGYPFEGAKTYTGNNEIITIVKAEALTKYNFEIISPGKILTFENNCPIITCGKNSLKVIEAKDSNNNKYLYRNYDTNMSHETIMACRCVRLKIVPINL